MHGVQSRSIIKDIANPLLQLSNLDYHDREFLPPSLADVDVTDPPSLAKAVVDLEKEVRAAAKRLEFEQAAAPRDSIRELRSQFILPGQSRVER